MMRDFSVLMAVYSEENPENFHKSIESVMNQTVVTDDFVIVCDGPLTDELNEVLLAGEKRYEAIRVFRLPQNGGLGPALNEGLPHCRHEIVARMDSDDICVPDRFALQLDALQSKNADIVSGTVAEFETDAEHIRALRVLPERHDDIVRYTRRRNPFNHPCVMFRKRSVEAAGGYVDFPFFEDYSLWVRMLQNGARAYNLPETLLYMRGNDNMYGRRGGLAYLKCVLRFRRWLLNIKFCSFFDFLMCLSAQTVICLIPGGMRKRLYRRFLRKR